MSSDALTLTHSDPGAPDPAPALRPAAGWYARGKPALDYALALALLPAAAVLVAVCALAVKLTSPGPAFYTQTRVGRNGRRFRIVKVRTMRHRCEARSGPCWSQPGDSRVTPVGRFLRATHLDELPQLWNVLRGEMSLVGPRPERPEIVEAKGLSRLVPGYDERLVVKPGVTGLAQVQLPPDTDLASVRRKVVYDLYYAEHSGLWLDLRILAGTLLRALGVGPRLLRRALALPGPAAVAGAFAAPRGKDDTGERLALATGRPDGFPAGWRAALASVFSAPPAEPAPRPADAAPTRAGFRPAPVPALRQPAGERRRGCGPAGGSATAVETPSTSTRSTGPSRGRGGRT